MSENWRADGISSILNVISQEQGVLIYDGRRIWMSQLKQRENPPFLQKIEIFVLFKPSSFQTSDLNQNNTTSFLLDPHLVYGRFGTYWSP